MAVPNTRARAAARLRTARGVAVEEAAFFTDLKRGTKRGSELRSPGHLSVSIGLQRPSLPTMVTMWSQWLERVRALVDGSL